MEIGRDREEIRRHRARALAGLACGAHLQGRLWRLPLGEALQPRRLQPRVAYAEVERVRLVQVEQEGLLDAIEGVLVRAGEAAALAALHHHALREALRLEAHVAQHRHRAHVGRVLGQKESFADEGGREGGGVCGGRRGRRFGLRLGLGLGLGLGGGDGGKVVVAAAEGAAARDAAGQRGVHVGVVDAAVLGGGAAVVEARLELSERVGRGLAGLVKGEKGLAEAEEERPRVGEHLHAIGTKRKQPEAIGNNRKQSEAIGNNRKQSKAIGSIRK